MPITISKIASNTADASFQWGEDTVNIIYYPGKITEKTLADIDAFSKTTGEEGIQAGFAMLNETMCSLIKSWDVLEDDGTMFPLDPKRVAELPILFRAEILSVIAGDVRPESAVPTKS